MQSNRGGGDRGNVDGVWEHDRFDDEEEEEEEIIERPVRSLSSSGGLETGAKLQISNLAFGVSDDDIKDLFEPLGDIKKAFVHYDKKDGRSLGIATVIYARRPSALEAIKKYNNVPLDGQAMKITLVATTGGAGGGARRVARGGDDGGVRSFRKAVNEAESFTIRVGGGNRSTRQTGRRVVVGRRGGRGAGGGGGGGRGGRGGRGRGGRSGGRQVYVRY
eukprot:Phypoly_transcript_11289.p1 GENE.Phypoly_transcript_11289~~Phypoly_transcript_11289.p1  ORF type:complete len:219 (+),score=32.33 Phypoly_transcript_11289:431-1087(+)